MIRRAEEHRRVAELAAVPKTYDVRYVFSRLGADSASGVTSSRLHHIAVFIQLIIDLRHRAESTHRLQIVHQLLTGGANTFLALSEPSAAHAAVVEELVPEPVVTFLTLRILRSRSLRRCTRSYLQ